MIKNHDEIMKILKRHLKNNISKKKIIFVFQNKIIFNDNNYVCFNWITYYHDIYLIYLSKKKRLIFKISSKKKTNYANSKKLRIFQLINLFKYQSNMLQSYYNKSKKYTIKHEIRKSWLMFLWKFSMSKILINKKQNQYIKNINQQKTKSIYQKY